MTENREPVRVPQELIDELDQRADCDDVARAFASRMVPYGNRPRLYYCPFCQKQVKRGTEGKLSTKPGGGRGWVCFKAQASECEKGGGALRLAALLQGWNLRNGGDFLDAVEWLAELVGYGLDGVRKVREAQARRYGRPEQRKRRDVPPPKRPDIQTPRPPDDQVLPPAALVPVWGSLEKAPRTQAAAWLTGERGLPDSVQDFAQLSAADVDALPWPDAPYTTQDDGVQPFGPWIRRTVQRHLERNGPAIVVPIRSAATGDVEAFNVRPLRPPPAGEKNRKTISRQSDHDGTPRGYGAAASAEGARLVVLTEGALDTLAAAALLEGVDGAIVIGAIYAKQMREWGAWLALRIPPGGCVVFAHHLDDDGTPTGAAGERAAVVGARTIRERRGNDAAALFSWATFVRELAAIGLDVLPLIGRGFDLGDVVRAAHAARLPWAVLQGAFRRTLGVELAATEVPPDVERTEEVPPPSEELPSTTCAPPDDEAPPPEPAVYEADVDDAAAYDVSDIINSFDGWNA